MPFSEKLKKLREENHYTQKYVAKHLNVARSTIAGYETKNRQPSHEKLTILAELFHVSVDYLLDDDISEITLSDTLFPYTTLKNQSTIFSPIFTAYLILLKKNC